MTETESSATKGKTFSMARVMVAVLVVVVIALVAFNIGKQVPQPDANRTKRILGMSDPQPRVFAKGLVDANGDLVADAPSDPKDCVDPEALLFSYVASPEAEQTEEAIKPLTDHLAAVTGKPVQYVRFEDERDQLDALSAGRLHITAINTGNVPEAVAADGFVPVATPAKDGEERGYTMQIIVPADSPIKKPEDIKGHEFAFTTAGSNSGFKAPLEVLLRQFHLTPETDYHMVFSMGHNQSIQGIAKGKYEVAAIASDLLEQAVAAGDVKPSDFRIIYTSEQFPALALGYVYNLDPDLAVKIREGLLDFNPEGTSVETLLTEDTTGFAPVDYKDDWALVRRIDESFSGSHK